MYEEPDRCDLVRGTTLPLQPNYTPGFCLKVCQSDFQAACAVGSAGGRCGDTVRDEISRANIDPPSCAIDALP
jgi:hypothetical protein